MSNRLNEREAEELLLHGDPVELGRRADAERRKRFDDTVTFIVDRNINYTNVCVNECRFCAFFRRKENMVSLICVAVRFARRSCGFFSIIAPPKYTTVFENRCVNNGMQATVG